MDKRALGRLFAYTEWANEKVMGVAELLPVADFRRDLHSSHGGVRGTLVHAMGAEWIWLERWKGLSPQRGIDEGEFPDVPALRARWQALAEHRRSWFASLREEATTAVISYRNLAGQPFQNPLWQLVQHVANHSTYHRGQVITLLRQLGSKVVGTDMVAWDREQAEGR